MEAETSNYRGTAWTCRDGVRKVQAHLVLKLARDVTGNKKSFYYHMSNKRINNESVHQLLNKSGDLLTVDADKALNSPARSCGPLYLQSSRRKGTTSTGKGLGQGSLKKSQLIEVPGEQDGFCRKVLRDCLMTLSGRSLIFQKL